MVQQPLDFSSSSSSSSSSSASASGAAPSFAGSVTWEEIACGQRKMSMEVLKGACIGSYFRQTSSAVPPSISQWRILAIRVGAKCLRDDHASGGEHVLCTRRLYPTNNRADAVNLQRLAALEGGEDNQFTYEADSEWSHGRA
jgi:hypothetical protein